MKPPYIGRSLPMCTSISAMLCQSCQPFQGNTSPPRLPCLFSTSHLLPATCYLPPPSCLELNVIEFEVQFNPRGFFCYSISDPVLYQPNIPREDMERDSFRFVLPCFFFLNPSCPGVLSIHPTDHQASLLSRPPLLLEGLEAPESLETLAGNINVPNPPTSVF